MAGTINKVYILFLLLSFKEEKEMQQQTKAGGKFTVEYIIMDSAGNVKAKGVEGCEIDVAYGIKDGEGNVKAKGIEGCRIKEEKKEE